MKFCRFGAPGLERPGLVDPTGVLRDLSAVVGDRDVLGLIRVGRVDDPESGDKLGRL